jgi:hypothetical protein
VYYPSISAFSTIRVVLVSRHDRCSGKRIVCVGPASLDDGVVLGPRESLSLVIGELSGNHSWDIKLLWTRAKHAHLVSLVNTFEVPRASDLHSLVVEVRFYAVGEFQIGSLPHSSK